MKNKNWPWLLALGVAVSWTSVEVFRLAEATQQVAASQELQLRVAAKVEAARARNAQFAHDDSSSTAAPGNPKR